MHYGWETVSAGVHRCRLPFLDVTVGLVHGPAGTLLIDCGTTLIEAQNIAEDVGGLAGAEVTHVVLTHHDFDHILGSGRFADARIYGAPAVAEAMSTGTRALREQAVRHGADAAEVDAAIAVLRPPDEVVTDAVIDLGDRLVTVGHPGRGHTDHDLVVVVPPLESAETVVVFCGDLVEESGDPVIEAGSDLAAWPATLDRVLELGGRRARYVPGHGRVVDANYVSAQQDWLRAR